MSTELPTPTAPPADLTACEPTPLERFAARRAEVHAQGGKSTDEQLLEKTAIPRTYRRRLNSYPWLADFVIWRARHSERVMRRVRGVLDETSNPGNLVSARGLARLILPIG